MMLSVKQFNQLETFPARWFCANGTGALIGNSNGRFLNRRLFVFLGR